MTLPGWKHLVRDCSFSGQGRYRIAAYSEYMPPARLGCRPYRGREDGFFSDHDLFGWPVTEFEEAFELGPGMENVAHQVLRALTHLAHGDAGGRVVGDKLTDNPFWAPELARRVRTLKHERFVVILPLALSITQDDKGRRRWTLFGGSEQGPFLPFWKSFFTAPGREVPDGEATGFLGSLLAAAWGETADLRRAGFRILAASGDEPEDLRPSWTSSFLWSNGMSLAGVRYLLSFEPFGNLPNSVRNAYFSGDLCLLPFPGSLLFWGAPGYLRMQKELPWSNQIPLLHVVDRHESPYGLRVPQSGWIHVPCSDRPLPQEGYGPVLNTFRRTHRWARVHRHEDEFAVGGRDEHILRVLFSTAPEDLDLYGKPMARNSQIWTQDHHLLLDGPACIKREIEDAIELIHQGGLFGYRFQYSPMQVGAHQVYWHRPLVAYIAPETEQPALLPDAPLGYLTGYEIGKADLSRPVELWPRLLRRSTQGAAIELFKDKKHEHKTITRALNLLKARQLMGKGALPRSFAQQILMLPEDKTLDEWLDMLAKPEENAERRRWLADQLRDIIEVRERVLPSSGTGRLPASLTFERTARRPFEVRYWDAIARLATGEYSNKANSDCVRDSVTQRTLKHHHRDLEALGDYLLAYYRRITKASDSLVGDLPFSWETDFDYDWWGGWVDNQEGRTKERNLIVVIPGRDRSRAVIMADHYDTAYMEDVYYRDEGGSGARLAAAGADDNHSATAALMQAAPVFCNLSRNGRLGCDVWLIHLTGEEFPSDCMGARQLSERLVEGNLSVRLQNGGTRDLSKTRIQGVFVLDMIAHNNEREPGVFQIAPGSGEEATWLAYEAHLANETWNASIRLWNLRPARRDCGRGKRSPDKNVVPGIALHPRLDGQVRLPRDPKSTLFNTDGQIFSDAGIPVVLFMENYDINRKGYHDSRDTMANIDLDYGAGVAAIAIETVARVACAGSS